MTDDNFARLPAHWQTKISPTRIQGCPVHGQCWVWTGGRNKAYGKLNHLGRTMQVHRAVYEHLVGGIPADLEMDHLCNNTYCCNPAHLEPVTRARNMRRARLRRLGYTWSDICKAEMLRKTDQDRLAAFLSQPSPTGLPPRSRFRRMIHRRMVEEATAHE